MFCKFCGRELKDGEICTCCAVETVEETEEEKQETVEYIQKILQVTEKKPNALERFGSVLAHYISHPLHAIGQAAEFGDWRVGLLCCLLQAILLAAGLCVYLITRVSVGYTFGFFEQAVPFGEYLAYTGSNMAVLFFQLAGSVLLADLFLFFLLLLFTGAIGRHEEISKLAGGVGTAILTSGFSGFVTVIAAVFVHEISAAVLFGGVVLSLLALNTAVRASAESSDTKLFYLLTLVLLIWFGGVNWLISSVPTLSWIFGLL